MHKIGDIIKDTVGFGDVKIVDAYTVTTHSEVKIYEIEVLKDGRRIALDTTEQLQPMFPTNQ